MLALKISVYSVVFFFIGIFMFGFLASDPSRTPSRKDPPGLSSSSTSPVLAVALAVLLQPLAVAAQEAVFPLGVDEPPLEAGVDITDPFADEPASLENSVAQPEPEAVISRDLLPPWDLELQANRV